MKEEFVIKTSVRKTIVYLIGCLMFVLVGVFIISTGDDLTRIIAGIAGIVFFGIGFFVLLYQVLDRRPRIVIGEKGVFDRTLRLGTIDWEDIEAVELKSVFSTNFITLQLVNPEKYLEKLSNTSKRITILNKKLGFGILNLNLSLIDKKPQKVYEMVMNRISRKRSDESFSFSNFTGIGNG